MDEETRVSEVEEVVQPSKLTETVLDLERLEHNLYRATNHWVEYGSKRLYGGQVICQAMLAACRTVQPELYINSLHCYFMRAGRTSIPVVYQVENLRDGRSFSNRSVHAIQNGQTIFIMILSFHVKESSPYNHQYAMPEVPMPESLVSIDDLIENYMSGASEGVKNKMRRAEGSGILLEFRHADIDVLIEKKCSEPRRLLWARVKGQLGGDENIHCCAAAYISDVFLSGTAYMPHARIQLGQMASLDHSIWFHAPFRADEWMLYEMESPSAGAARGMAFGRLWRRDGTLAASISQECLMRPKL